MEPGAPGSGFGAERALRGAERRPGDVKLLAVCVLSSTPCAGCRPGLPVPCVWVWGKQVGKLRQECGNPEQTSEASVSPLSLREGIAFQRTQPKSTSPVFWVLGFLGELGGRMWQLRKAMRIAWEKTKP